MRAASVFGVDDVAVGGELVGAHPEHQSQRSGHREIEAAVPAHTPGGPGHRRPGTVLTVVPALRSIGASPRAEHLPAAEPHLRGDLVDLGVSAGHVTGHQPGIVGRRGEQVAGAQIARLDPLMPGHPLRREQRRRPGHQHDFADGGVIRAGTGGDDDRPLPAAVTRHVGQEPVRSRSRILEAGAEVLTDGVLAAELDDRRACCIGGAQQHRLEVRPGRGVPLGVSAPYSADSVTLSIAIDFARAANG